MKLLFLLFSISFTSAIAQQAVIANEKLNIVYYGVNNRLSVSVAGYPCQSVVLTTESGKIEKGECGKFIYIPNFIGDIELKVWVKLKQAKSWSTKYATG